MNLIIVESPTKAKTIKKFLGSTYAVESSYGHIRDLPKSKMGIDIDNNFEPTYEIPERAKKNVSKLKTIAKKADKIILASDEDREGEAIAWHLAEVLKIPKDKIERIVFHEITKNAILDALKNPKKTNDKMVDAQQARRILDRLVGYELSPFLWKKVARGLSAGRVQSVATRLIVEREREIKAFNAEEYWNILANLETSKKELLETTLHKIDGKTVSKLQIKNKKESDAILKKLKEAKYTVKKIDKKQAKKNPPKPFTTSTLQQAANRMLGFSSKQTMMLAQKLYEGIDIKGEGHVGLITYMRTDSLNLSEKFLNEAKEFIEKNFDKKYSAESPRKFKTKSKGAQEAHEAIRPTEASRTPESLINSLDKNQHRLYELIWQRAVASQMAEAIVNATSIDIDAEKTPYQFRITGQTLEFKGYLEIYPEKSKDIELPEVKEKDELSLKELKGDQHFTKPPARYSDAGLVKIMEKHGIGRPSTYSPTISTIIARNYVNRDDNKKLFPTPIAFVVIDLLVNHFSDVVDYEFTAEMEDDLDAISQGDKKWQPIIKNFYTPFHKNLLIKTKEINKEDIMPEEKSKEKCEKCGELMVIKTGRFGKFLACSGYPDCKNIKAMDVNHDGVVDEKDKEASEEIKKLQEKYKGEICEKCGSPMAIKTGKFGPFLACTGYPKCKNIKSIGENNSGTGVKCPVCKKGEIVQKRSKRGVFYACDQYPDCKTAFWGKPTGKKCPNCKALMIEAKDGGSICSAKGCGYKE